MNKFRARQLDASRPIAIWIQPDEAELTEQNNATNRTVPQLPTGMEKEEETEHHLQQAIYHQRVIPVPEVFDTTQNAESKIFYDKVYPPTFKIPRQFIHIHPFATDQEITEYDMDSEDEKFLESHRKRTLLPLDPAQFEEMMDRLEKASGIKAVTLQEAKLFLKDDDDLITAVYDYWLNKRLGYQHALISMVRSEKCVGSSPTDPYVAFRKRTEKMQTRKNRKNDEVSYEKMLKLKRDLRRVLELLNMLANREKLKLQHAKTNKDIYEKRYSMEDFSGSILNELLSLRPKVSDHHRSAFDNLLTNHGAEIENRALWRKQLVPGSDVAHRKEDSKKERRPYRKKRRTGHSNLSSSYNNIDPFNLSSGYSQDGPSSFAGSDDDLASHSEAEDDSNLDGQFAFKRKAYVTYRAPREPWGRCDTEEPLWNPSLPKRPDNMFCLTSIDRNAPRFIGRARRRIGRGGRIWLDRSCLPVDRLFNIKDDGMPKSFTDISSDTSKSWPHFQPPVTCELGDPDDVDSDSGSISTQDVPSSVLITAEVLEGDWAGSLSQVEVTSCLSEGAGAAPSLDQSHSCVSSSRFMTYEREMAPLQLSVTYNSEQVAGSSSSFVNNSCSSLSVAPTAIVKNKVEGCAVDAPSTLSSSTVTFCSSLGSPAVKFSDSDHISKNNHSSHVQKTSKEGSSFDSSNSIFSNSKENSDTLICNSNAGSQKKVNPWALDHPKETPLSNGPSTKSALDLAKCSSPKVSSIVFSETGNS